MRGINSKCDSIVKKSIETLQRCRTEGVATSAESLNIVSYAVILNRDMNCMLSRLWNTNDDWERKLICRHLALAILEGLEDLAELNGQCLREFAQNTKTREELKIVSQKLSQLRIQHEADLRKLRVTAAAHRDKDANTLISSITTVDAELIEQLGWAMNSILLDAMSTFLDIVQSGCEGCKMNKKAKTSVEALQLPTE